MSHENLRDSLPGAKRRRDDTPPPQHYRASKCEYRNGWCNGRGKADVAIQDANKNVQGYVCQQCYMHHLTNRGMDQMATFKVEGVKARDEVQQATLDQQRTYHHITDVLSDLDRYADSTHDKDDSDAP